MNIDWSKAPEDATHFNRSGLFFKFDENLNARFYDGFWWRGNGLKLGDYDTVGELIERPKKQEAWDGEGLPPVDCLCETFDVDANCWVKVEIYAHTELMGETNVCAKNGTDMFYGLAHEFRPIRTAEQLAEEERKSQLELMHKIYMEGASEHKGGIAALYDAGYKLAK